MANGNRISSLLTQATAIVASILLAFAIDAWWDSRADREAEQSAINRLVIEFDQNLSEIANVREVHQKALNATERLLALTGPDRRGVTETTDLGRALVECLTNPTFDPRLGTTNSLIASGDLHLIRDKQLQSMLTEWPAAAQNLIRWQDIERMHGEELILPFTYDYVAWPDIDSALGLSQEPSRFANDYNGLFSSLLIVIGILIALYVERQHGDGDRGGCFRFIPFAAEVSFAARVGVGRDEWHEERAILTCLRIAASHASPPRSSLHGFNA